MTDKQTDVKTYNCVYCNKTLTKFETQPLYKDGKFLTTCEECWNKHAKEEGYVVPDVQTINTTIDDKQIIIDGCDVSGCECYSEHREGYCGWYTLCEGDSCPYKLKWALQQLKAKEQECEELKETVDGLLKVQYKLADSNKKLRQCLTEIKEVLQLYNNTTIGTDKGNGIFEFEVCNDNVLGGKLICCYDTNPAKKALQKCEVILDEKM